MKTKILYFILPLLLLASPAKAQYWGVEYLPIMIMEDRYLGDPESYLNAESYIGGVTYEQRITPHFSLQSGLLLEVLIDRFWDNTFPFYDDPNSTYYDYHTSSMGSARLVIPIKAEYKFLLSNLVRLYVNGGVQLKLNMLSYWEYWDYSQIDDDFEKDHYQVYSNFFDEPTFGSALPLALTAGVGIEIGGVRVGVSGMRDLFQTFDIEDLAVFQYFGFQFGLRFNGNKLYKRKSKIKTGTVDYPILQAQTHN